MNLCYNILGQHSSHASPNKLPECQSFLLCFDARAFLCIIFQPNFSVVAKTFDVDANFLIVAFSLFDPPTLFCNVWLSKIGQS